MRILCLFITYPNKPNNHNMFKDLTENLVKDNHVVDVITINERKNNRRTHLSKENGVNVLRVKTLNFFDTNFIEKGFSMLSLGLLFKRAFKKNFKYEDYDMVIHSCPPVTYIPLIKYLKSKTNIFTYLILRDIFPDNAKDMGAMNDFLYKYFKSKELKNYSISNAIGCMSKGNIDYVTSKNKINKKKFHILENWGRDIEINISEKESIKLLEKYDANNKFNVIFGGNMGAAQSLSFILDVAKEIYQIDKDLNFIFVGRGIEKQQLISRVKKENIKNVSIYDYVPREEYERLVKVCDLGLVSLSSRYNIPNIPSKTVDYFKLSVPVIACIDKNTDYGDEILKKYNTGVYSTHGDIKGFVSNLLDLKKKPSLLKKMKLNARRYYEEHYKPEIAISKIIDAFNNRGEKNELF